MAKREDTVVIHSPKAAVPVWDIPEESWERLKADCLNGSFDWDFYGYMHIGSVLVEIKSRDMIEFPFGEILVKGYADPADFNVDDDGNPFASDFDRIIIELDEVEDMDFEQFKSYVEREVCNHICYDGLGVLVEGYTDDWDAILAGANGSWDVSKVSESDSDASGNEMYRLTMAACMSEILEDYGYEPPTITVCSHMVEDLMTLLASQGYVEGKEK